MAVTYPTGRSQLAYIQSRSNDPITSHHFHFCLHKILYSAGYAHLPTYSRSWESIFGIPLRTSGYGTKYLCTPSPPSRFVPSHSPVAICVIFQEEKNFGLRDGAKTRQQAISLYHQPLLADKRPFSSCTNMPSYQLAILILTNVLLGGLASCRLFALNDCFSSAETR